MGYRVIIMIAQLTRREQLFLGIGGFCFFTYIFYALLYMPMQRSIASKAAHVSESRATLQFMQQASDLLAGQQKSRPVLTSPIERVRAIEARMQAKPLSSFHYELTLIGDDDFSLSFEQVPFDALFQQLLELSERNAVTMTEFHVTKHNQAGMVRAIVHLHFLKQVASPH